MRFLHARPPAFLAESRPDDGSSHLPQLMCKGIGRGSGARLCTIVAAEPVFLAASQHSPYVTSRGEEISVSLMPNCPTLPNRLSAPGPAAGGVAGVLCLLRLTALFAVAKPAPVAASPLVQELGECLGQAVSEGLDHDGVVVVVILSELLHQLQGAKSRRDGCRALAARNLLGGA